MAQSRLYSTERVPLLLWATLPHSVRSNLMRLGLTRKRARGLRNSTELSNNAERTPYGKDQKEAPHCEHSFHRMIS